MYICKLNIIKITSIDDELLSKESYCYGIDKIIACIDCKELISFKWLVR